MAENNNTAATEKGEKKESTAKLDFLRKIELEVQKEWEEAHIFEEDAPAGIESSPDNKYLATFPYPYMNGKLHLGHTFTLTKAEFAVNYNRLKGKHVLFPFGFHCTGMPIKAVADKLKREIETYGNPPVFPEEEKKEEEAEKPLSEEDQKKVKEDPLAFHAQKSKTKSKSGGAKYQWNIMLSMGVPAEEIPKFADANHWLSYFPPIAVEDLKKLGLGVDWRRSFITTEVNQYYDSFVRWQFEKLREKNKLQFGKRYAIYSPKDGQPCADHDRQSGEGVLPQEYTLIKCEVLGPFPEKFKQLEGKYKVYLVPGTLRPETMYGQTNVWVLPEGDYGVYEVNDTEAFVCTERAARNLAYQHGSKVNGQVNCLAKIKGWDILGIKVKAPLTHHEFVYTLPMTSISPYKGTGIVTSVPSDAPDDYMNLEELRKKPLWREKFNIKDEMVLPFEVIPIIDVPGLGNTAAAAACTALKIKSPNDRDLLDQAKEQVYTKGFYEGVMLVGEHKGKPVQEAKPLIKNKMIADGLAFAYAEPTAEVISRSGDVCVVALTDQWFVDYGETKWRAQVEEHLKSMELFSPDTRTKFEIALGWLNQWACSRTYGLGTKLPWDQQYLIDSLSDSTIYMSFYAVAHLLQGGIIDGSKPGPAGIKPEQMTKAVWNYIFLKGEYPADCGIPEETLKKLRQEFEFWYPVDLRVSGKDLITNHLVFFLYNHAAIWDSPKYQPRGIRANGHILLDGEKMSKSTGNFMTLTDGIEQFSADGMRFALADAGDSLDDANFSKKTAIAALLRLHAQMKWTEDTLKQIDTLRAGPATGFFDRVFESQMNQAIKETDHHYERANYRDALQTGFYALQAARDAYRLNVGGDMSKELVLRFIEVQALVMVPICPHFSEYTWKLLGKKGFARKAAWPTASAIDHTVLEQNEYLQNTIHNFRLRKDLHMKPKAKKGAPSEPVPVPKKAVIVVAKSYPEWMRKGLTLLKPMVEAANKGSTKVWPDDKEVVKVLTADDTLKKLMKQVMPFIATIKEDFLGTKGIAALDLELPFDEKKLMEEHMGLLKSNLDVSEFEFQYDDTAQKCRPGSPHILFQ